MTAAKFQGLTVLESVDVDAELLKMVTAPAGRFGPHNTPDYLLPMDHLAMVRAREARLGSWNDLRQAMGFKRHRRFSDFSSSRAVVQTLRKYYKSVDDVEIVPAMFAEDPTEYGWGAGETLGFGIVSDALSSVRHDRWLTTNYTAEHYTAWGSFG